MSEKYDKIKIDDLKIYTEMRTWLNIFLPQWRAVLRLILILDHRLLLAEWFVYRMASWHELYRLRIIRCRERSYDQRRPGKSSVAKSSGCVLFQVQHEFSKACSNDEYSVRLDMVSGQDSK